MLNINLHLLDVLGVLLIIAFSVFWLFKNFINLKKAKCGTICTGCTVAKCNTKVFSIVGNGSKELSRKFIEIHKI